MKTLVILFLITSNFCLANSEALKQTYVSRTESLKGWCPSEKCEALIDSILELEPEICVEIGVYAGKSLIPIAGALKYLGKGTVIGIDPWQLNECVKNYSKNHVVSQFWENINLEKTFQEFMANLEDYDIQDFCKIIRLTSVEAVDLIGPIDLLHIDGNHSEESVLQDVMLYFEKVRPGGYIWLDDVLRHTTAKSYSIVAENSTLIRSVGRGNCLLYRKN